jgi:hypothetical protein
MQAVAIAWDKYDDEAKRLAEIVEAFGEKPIRAQRQPLAGPNDVLMWIGDPDHWATVGLAVLVFLRGKIADDAYDFLKKRMLAKFGGRAAPEAPDATIEAITAIVREMRAKGGTFQLKVSYEAPPPAGGDAVVIVSPLIHYFPPLDEGGAGEIMVARHLVETALNAETLATASPERDALLEESNWSGVDHILVLPDPPGQDDG